VERTTLFVDVILPLPVPGTFTYRVPSAMNEQVKEGIRAVVQFGSRKIYTALIRRVHEEVPKGTVPKYILSVLDASPVVHEKQFLFWEWIADYYLCTLGEVMNAALPSAMKLASETKILLDPEWKPEGTDLAEREAVLVEALRYHDALTISEAAEILDQQKVIPIVKTMYEKGMILLEEELTEKVKPRTEMRIRLKEPFDSDEARLKETFDLLEKKARKQLEVLMAFIRLSDYSPGKKVSVLRSALYRETGEGAAALGALVKKDVFEAFEIPAGTIAEKEPAGTPHSIAFSPAQEKTLETIRDHFRDKEVVLLHGVTSGGKTEIYVQLIRETIGRGRQALYLLPEIALSTQVISRLRKYFGNRIGIYHSRLSDQERAEVWKHAMEGRYDVILGARSALFLPLADPGIIIVDEEHDYSFKQMDPAPRYNARDAAVYLAHLHHGNALLGSATPSVESYFNAKQGKYGMAELFVRFGEMEMPQHMIVDTRAELREGKMKSHFSSILIEQLGDALKNREQAILFQNRRGFSLRIECETCHWMPMCKNCDVTLVYHKGINQLRCHYCGYVMQVPDTCPDCKGTALRMKGFGTERVEEDLQLLFPHARIARMDLDTTRTKNSHQRIINSFEERQIDFLVGTQMVTKGLDFDHVSTVCILNADNMLSYPDFRSPERSFQLMAQVSGRAGRKNKRGMVIIQTWQPSHPVIRDVIANDYNAMYIRQLSDRYKFKYPPFYRLVLLKLKHKEPELLNKAAKRLADILRPEFGRNMLGPEYPIVSKIMNYYIKQIMIKIEKGGELPEKKHLVTAALREFAKAKEFSQVRVIVDVDPL
jgi:primosomal protein N' (replication factor Y) (superfamily II helicase)